MLASSLEYAILIPMQTITPFLWFDGKAEEAMKFYVSIFRKSKILSVSRDGKKVISATFQLNGQDFMALNGGPDFKFTPAISFFVECQTQKEVDHFWEKLSKGGKKQQCGWLTDKFGISWQIIPSALGQLMGSADEVKAERVWRALMEMDKIDIEVLKQAYRGAQSASRKTSRKKKARARKK